jgi:HlyD family secretion protein
LAEQLKKPDLSRLTIPRASDIAPKHTGSITPNKLWWGAGIFAVAVFSFFIWRSGAEETTPSPNPVTVAPAISAVAPTTATTLSASGYVVAQRQAAVASKGTGRIAELRVQEGDAIAKDSIIAVLENEDIKASLNERAAQVAALTANVVASRAKLVAGERRFNRVKSLRTRDVASVSDFDEAEAQFKIAAAELIATEANLRLAEAQHARAEIELSYTYIRAPFDGTVLSKNADIGEVVAPFGSSTNARAAVVTIADLSSLEVEADVSEANISKVKLGQTCSIVLDSFPERRYRGEVIKIVPTVDRAKATVLTKIKFLDRDEHVLPEMSAKIGFEVGK